MTDESDLGQAIERLRRTIEERKTASPETSYTAQLLSAGVPRCAQKLGEEGVEAAIAAALGDRKALVGEAADLVYHLLVLLVAAGVPAAALAAELDRRSGRSGLVEKAER